VVLSRWTAFGALAANLLLFIAVTSAPAFQELHHHWIFPVLAGLLSLEWALAGGGGLGLRRLGPVDLAGIRATALSILAFLILMGVVRHWSILTCFGRCSLKLGSAAALAGLVFAAHSRADEALFWGKRRSRAAAAGCLLWAVYLFLFGLGVPALARDGLYLAAAGALLLKGRAPLGRLAGLGIVLGLGIRWSCAEVPAIALGLALGLGGLWAAGRQREAPLAEGRSPRDSVCRP